MAIIDISAVKITTSLGGFTVPVIKIDNASAAASVTLDFESGQQIGGSLSACVDDNLVYSSVIGELPVQATYAFDLIGAVNSYSVEMSAPTSNLYGVFTTLAATTTPSSGVVGRSTMQYWRRPNRGSVKYNIIVFAIIIGQDNIPYWHTFSINEYYESTSILSGTFSFSTPQLGSFGSFVIDIVFGGSISTQTLSGTQSDVNTELVSDLLDNPYISSSDPYYQGGESDIGGGTGSFDGTSIDVDFASLPTLSAVDTGFITLYNPNLVQLQSLASYMWSGLFDIDTFKKLFADPMQAILGLSIVPGPVPSGATQSVRIGNIDSGVQMTKAATQYIDIDCGTLNVEEFWGAYLDYEPYTKAEIFLPFIGVHQIAIDDIMNKAVHIKYHIDLLSGGCACEIKCGGSVLYTFIGSCAVSIPVTGSDWTNLLNGVLSAASAIGTMVATGGAAAPAAASTLASAAVNSLKPSIEKSGSIAGAGGLLAGKVPVLILTRPRQALPGKQNTFTGYPAFVTRSLGALSGYTEVHSIRLSGIDGTESEIDEIEELLKGGVIL